MQQTIRNKKVVLSFDPKRGLITRLEFLDDADGMNWLISPAILESYGFSDSIGCLLGKSHIEFNHVIDTGELEPSEINQRDDSICFKYNLDGLMVTHLFTIGENFLDWSFSIKNTGKADLEIEKMYHWLPLAYIMHKDIQENVNHSCSMVPSIAGNHSHIICRKRRSKGDALYISNRTGKMKSVGSLCRYTNLFFEKTAPSLNGLVLYNVVNAYKNSAIESDPLFDWQYREMYQSITIEPGAQFDDGYAIRYDPTPDEKKALQSSGCAVVDYEPVLQFGHSSHIEVHYASPVRSCVIYGIDDTGLVLEHELPLPERGNRISLPAQNRAGEKKLELEFQDGTRTFVIFAVYESVRDIIVSFCNREVTSKFIDDVNSKYYCAYESVSPQGESCAKGSFILLKNLLTRQDSEEIRQVERNAVNYLKKNWLNDDFTAVKKYPGGFARIFDLDYLIMEFYYLSLCETRHLALNSADTYLEWSCKIALYRFSETPDKLPRENAETHAASMIPWIQLQMFKRLEEKGFINEAHSLQKQWKANIEEQCAKIANLSFIVTEHYFDNAGIACTAETLVRSGKIEEGVQAAELLLSNVASSSDYRNFAPDRWWEALACMYHNLWAVLSAKAMLTVYEYSLDNRFLLAAYKAMMPMFYNYDWNARSAPGKLIRGEGVSAYCITSPNLNNEYCSRNRFGQSVFKGEFFEKLELSGDDWDLGVDLIAYLSTFGQFAYITRIADENRCVNGSLHMQNGQMTVESFAAFPAGYFIEENRTWIIRGNTNFTMNSMTVENGECIAVTIEKTDPAGEVVIRSICNGVEMAIHPTVTLQRVRA
jgi:hypothetical protein